MTFKPLASYQERQFHDYVAEQERTPFLQQHADRRSPGKKDDLADRAPRVGYDCAPNFVFGLVPIEEAKKQAKLVGNDRNLATVQKDGKQYAIVELLFGAGRSSTSNDDGKKIHLLGVGLISAPKGSELPPVEFKNGLSLVVPGFTGAKYLSLALFTDAPAEADYWREKLHTPATFTPDLSFNGSNVTSQDFIVAERHGRGVVSARLSRTTEAETNASHDELQAVGIDPAYLPKPGDVVQTKLALPRREAGDGLIHDKVEGFFIRPFVPGQDNVVASPDSEIGQFLQKVDFTNGAVAAIPGMQDVLDFDEQGEALR